MPAAIPDLRQFPQVFGCHFPHGSVAVGGGMNMTLTPNPAGP
jgi:hypothetical protein